MNKYLLSIAIAALFLLPVVAQAESARDNYKTYCMQCHGLKGTGMGADIQDMSVQPRDHTDGKAMGGRTDAEIFKVIKEGGLAINKSALMPPWGDTFTDNEINDLVKYLRKLCKCSHEG
ncbi:MAG: cytochrome c [Mariprofundaceae bacterium]|nr:cytochrome c [Mariprofundaceae bacterium]